MEYAQQCEDKDACQNHQRAWFPTSPCIDGLQIVGKRGAQCLLRIRLHVVGMKFPERQAHFFWRDVILIEV